MFTECTKFEYTSLINCTSEIIKEQIPVKPTIWRTTTPRAKLVSLVKKRLKNVTGSQKVILVTKGNHNPRTKEAEKRDRITESNLGHIRELNPRLNENQSFEVFTCKSTSALSAQMWKTREKIKPHAEELQRLFCRV